VSRRRSLVAGGLAAALALAGAAALGLVPGLLGPYRVPAPALAAAFRARETCACVFVEGRGEAECLAWTRVSPDVARVEIDRSARAVEARALLLWRARALWAGPERGCHLE